MKTLFLTTVAFAALVIVAPIGNAHANATFAPCEGKVVTIAGQHFDMEVDSLRRAGRPSRF
jgi:capsular polysaccharide biosynthesis protein